MNDVEYTVFEKPFLEIARPLMQALRRQLMAMGHGPFIDVEEVNHDTERGLWFCDVETSKTVELLLTDGDDRGYEGCGLLLTCSEFPSGQAWAPGNYSESVGTSDPQEIVRRLKEDFSVEVVADQIGQEWLRIQCVEDQEGERG